MNVGEGQGRRATPRLGRAAFALACTALLALTALLGSSAAPAGAAEACPNEAIRAEQHPTEPLPDCRAYELVTPAYKEGQYTGILGFSENGLHAIAGSLGVFAGAEEDSLGNTGVVGAVYELSRTPSGWRAASLGPPASAYRSNGMYDASSDFGSSLWELGTLAQPEGVTDFYIEPSPGAFTEIGPATPEPAAVNQNKYSYRGGSHTLSHILFSTLPAFRWPFDQTAGEGTSLYEYVGTGNTEPVLVGVRGGTVGSTDLVSTCGTALGSGAPVEGGGSLYNAISGDGRRVFFTALACGENPPVDELFAREELPARAMRTVAISEPAAEHCEECLTSAGLRNAVFEGASEDGSKAFFLTSQELLPEARGENLYEYDFNGPSGHKVKLISAGSTEPQGARVQGVARISEDGSHVYFVAEGVLTPEEETNSFGDRPIAGADNLYMLAGGHTSFIATLSATDKEDWQREDFRPTLASRDGRYLVFTSVADLTHEGLSGAHTQVFQYDAQTGALVRASIGQDGYNNDGRALAYGARISQPRGYYFQDSPAKVASALAPEDGAVFFRSADALTPHALNGQFDQLGDLVSNIYEYRDGRVYLISDGKDISAVNSGSSVNLLGSSGSGEDVFFTTADSLTAQDTDTQQDLYDVHVGGGFAPSPLPPACSGDACQGSPSTPPPAQPSTSAGFSGPGNPSPKRGGHHKRHHQHQKKHKPHRHRAANHDRGGSR